MDEPSMAEQPPAQWVDAPRAPRRFGLSIYSILLIMLLSVSVLSSIVVGVIGYVNGTQALRSLAYQRLVEIRENRSREVEELFRTIENTVSLGAKSETSVQAVREFSSGFDELQAQPASSEASVAVSDYYRDVFAPDLEKATGKPVDGDAFTPTDAAQTYLQAHYVVPFTSWEAAIVADDAGDGSAWSAAHANYHEYYRAMTKLGDFQDVLLVDTDGNVVYTAYKGVDLGTNLFLGPYRLSNLADAYRQAMGRNIVGDVVVTDFAPYNPSLGMAGWAVTPIAQNGAVLGALAVELPIDRINQVMTVDEEWAGNGLGATGETYLIGSDTMMRSISRALIEDPSDYEKDAIAAGLAPDAAALAVQQQNTLLLQNIEGDVVPRAFAGESGTDDQIDYLGRSSLTAFAPLHIDGLDWAVIAQESSAEALTPVEDFTRNLILSTAGMIIVVCLLSLMLAQVFVRPLQRLKTAAGRIAAGEEGVRVDAGSSDELADVARAFNSMSRSLKEKSDAADAARRSTEQLLREFMPEGMAERYRAGDEAIVQDGDDVTVVFADIVGMDELALTSSSEDALARSNELVRAFDDAAARHGMERVRATRQSYLASCGLVTPRVDHARRAAAFAAELELIVARYGAQRGIPLTLRAGLDSGKVSSGLIGTSGVVYDLWGDTVSLAFRVRSDSDEPGIFLTRRVADRLPDSVVLEPAGELATHRGSQAVFRLASSTPSILSELSAPSSPPATTRAPASAMDHDDD